MNLHFPGSRNTSRPRATLDEFVETLTMIDLEEVDDKSALKPFVIARVLTAEKHPDADKLKVLTVDPGGMPDLRAFFDADVRWLQHYGFRPLDLPTLFGGLSS